MRSRLELAAVAGALGLLAAACGSSPPPRASAGISALAPAGNSSVAVGPSPAGSPTPSSLLTEVASSGTLTIGTSNDAPWSYVDPTTHQAEGVIPQMLAAFLSAQHIAARVEAVPMPAGRLAAAVRSGRIQLIGDAISATPALAKELDFTSVIFYNPETLAVNRGNPYRIVELSELCGRSAGTSGGGIWLRTLDRARAACPARRRIAVRTYRSPAELLAALASGRLTAGLVSAATVAAALNANPGLNVQLSPGYQPAGEPAAGVALAIGKGNQGFFLADFNAWYEQQSRDGFMTKLLAKWGLTPTSYWLAPSG